MQCNHSYSAVESRLNKSKHPFPPVSTDLVVVSPSMEWNAETLDFLSRCFQHTLLPNPDPRRRAESSLAEAADRPNYGLAVLRLVSESSVDEQIRQAAAVNFKNHLKRRWSISDSNVSSLSPIPDSEKEQIKALILPLMLSSSLRIQSQLSEGLSVIGKYDFPKSWPALLPELVSSLRKASQSSDYLSINGILSTANSIFKKFRFLYKTNDLLLDLKYCLDNFAAPLLDVFLVTSAQIDSVTNSGGAASVLRHLIESQRICCRIFYSLNFQDLPEYFEDHMKEWMGEFQKYLTTMYSALEEGGGDGVAVVDGLRAAVCENISLYMEKNEEEFQVYLNDFALAVWRLLGNVSSSSSRERLTITAIRFLTTVSTSVHHKLFGDEDVIKQICQSIVIPNVMIRDEDEEMFEMNYVEFIRRDMEGSDVDTRRRIACELLKGIATNYKDQVTQIFSTEIKSMLSSFAMNSTANWKYKDCAIFLVVSLATKKAGSFSLSTDLVDIQSFFGSVIVPELKIHDSNSAQMLKSAALKFFTMFRIQIQKDIAVSLIPDVVRFLGSDSNVVHSYAAICIEKLLLIKDGGVPRYTSADIAPVLPLLMANLFNALRFPESEENPYIMKCVMRVLGVADISREVAGPGITGLTTILGEVCKNPKNPLFNHYLFESVAVLVRRACGVDPTLISAFEISLFPSLQMILANDIAEFFPYTFQLLAQLVELNNPPIPPNYMQIFELLLSPESWKKTANVPALVRLLQAFLQKMPHELNREGRLSQVLGIFNMLVLSPGTDEQGFYVLNTVTENLEFDVMASYMSHIWAALFMRLQNKRTLKFVKSFIIFMSLFLVKHGWKNLESSMNMVQPNIFILILDQFWIPNLKTITGAIELKLTAAASTRLLCEYPTLHDAATSNKWGKLLDSIVTLVSRPEEDRVEEEPEMPEIGEVGTYAATFVNLYNAGKQEEDPLKEIKDPKEFLVGSLANLSACAPGRYPQIINGNLGPANQSTLLQLCSAYKFQIV